MLTSFEEADAVDVGGPDDVRFAHSARDDKVYPCLVRRLLRLATSAKKSVYTRVLTYTYHGKE